MRDGYKMTEVGVIPGDWEVVELSTIAKVSSGKRLPSGYYVTKEVTAYPYLRVADMNMGAPDTTDLRYLPKGANESIKSYRIFNREIYISVAGTLGIVGMIPKRLDGANLTENANRISDIKCDEIFLLNIMMSDVIQSVIKSEATLGAQPKLALGRIRGFQIPLPPTKTEQRRIAAALGDVDGWIRSLEALLAKKRLVKAGVSGELLRPGVGWREVRLGEVVISNGLIRGPFGGALKKEFFVDKGFAVYEQRHAIHKDLRRFRYNIGDDKMRELSRFKVQSGDLLVSCSGTIGQIVEVPDSFIEGVINQALLIIRVDEVVCNKDYFKAVFTSPEFQEKIIDSTQGGAMKNMVGMSEFKESIIHLPPTIEQQTQIAQTLSTLDAELSILEAKLAKARMLKAGMMGDLLTGRVRLV